MTLPRSTRLAGVLAFLSAALHLIGIPLGGYAQGLAPLITGTIAWIALALGVLQGSRGMAWAAFAMALFGIVYSAATSAALPPSALQWVWTAILITDIAIALCLAVTLWRSAPQPQTAP